MGKVINVALIATYPKMSDIFMDTISHYKNMRGISYYASFEKAVDLARDLERKGEADIILSRGGTAAQIEKAVDLPVVFIPITPFDLIRELHLLDRSIKEIAFIHYNGNASSTQEISKMYDIDIHEYSFENRQDIEEAVKDAREKGIEHIIGGEVSVRLARNSGLTGHQISAGEEAVERAIEEATNVWNEKQKEKKRAELIRSAFASMKEGIVVTDEEKRIVFINPIASKIFGKNMKTGVIADDSIVNQECREAYQTCREVPIYLKKLGKDIYSIAHIPVTLRGHFIGVVSRYEDVTKTQALEQKIRKELNQKGFVARYQFKDIMTEDITMERIINRAGAYAKTDSAVLIEGESGTGKELFAQSIHNASSRKEGPFVAVNCAALPENLLESELFGYEPGAFTGAKKEGKAGLFEMAHKGTLFLDEIGEISKSVQTRLLRVLQEKEIMRVGGNRIIPVDVRIISATNQNLKEKSLDGSFRGDLYYRLNVLKIKLPPLRARKGDAILLGRQFFKNYYEDDSSFKSVEPLLEKYSWPGNIRELQNAMERYGVLMNVMKEDLGNEDELEGIFEMEGRILSDPDGWYIKIKEGNSLSELIASVESDILNRYLDKYNGNQEAAAKALGISRTTFWRKHTAQESEK